MIQKARVTIPAAQVSKNVVGNFGPFRFLRMLSIPTGATVTIQPIVSGGAYGEAYPFDLSMRQNSRGKTYNGCNVTCDKAGEIVFEHSLDDELIREFITGTSVPLFSGDTGAAIAVPAGAPAYAFNGISPSTRNSAASKSLGVWADKGNYFHRRLLGQWKNTALPSGEVTLTIYGSIVTSPSLVQAAGWPSYTIYTKTLNFAALATLTIRIGEDYDESKTSGNDVYVKDSVPPFWWWTLTTSDANVDWTGSWLGFIH